MSNRLSTSTRVAKSPITRQGNNGARKPNRLQKCRSRCRPKNRSSTSSCPKDFSVELFASEPDIGGKPIAMTWDERGRLWICETYDYPNELQPEGKGRDRIRICEDTDGDWQADKFTVFAEELEHSDQHHVPSRRCDRAERHRDAVSERHRWRRRRGRATGADHRLERKATRTAASAIFSMVSTTGSGRCRATTLRRRRSTASTQQSFRMGFFRFRPRWIRRRSSSSVRPTTTPGDLGSAKKGSSSARPPTAIPASTCRSPIVTTNEFAAGQPS